MLAQRRAEQLWIGAAAFAVSILWLMFIGRTFNNYYLVWPMTAGVIAALMALGLYLSVVRLIDLDPGEAILHDGDEERCVVLLPGVRYFSQAPLLWFAREAAQAEGWSVLEVSERAPRDVDPFAWMGDVAERALAATSATQVAFVGKSLASVVAPLATQRALPAVWLTSARPAARWPRRWPAPRGRRSS